jgi:parallel beta-helix repeat protein
MNVRFGLVEVEAPNGYQVHNLNTGLTYTTIQEAIDALETLDGHTIFVEEGTYYENVVVDKSLKLVGEEMNSTIIDGGLVGNVTQVLANDVLMANFTICNSGVGLKSAGIMLVNVIRCSIIGNNIKNNQNGIWLYFSTANMVLSNEVEANDNDAIIVSHCSDTTLMKNNLTANGRYGVNVEYSESNIITINHADRNGDDGILIHWSSNNTILDNQAIYNAVGGLRIEHSWGNTVVQNTVSDGYYGIRLSYGCTSNNSLVRNSVHHNFVGIDLRQATNNSITENDITANRLYGIALLSSSYNKVYHNDFITNGIQAHTEKSYYNIWNENHISGGNFWSGYKERYPDAADDCGGAYQNETGSDGIWDLPYIIDEHNMDQYPIVPEFSSFLILPLFMVATLIAAVTMKRKPKPIYKT